MSKNYVIGAAFVLACYVAIGVGSYYYGHGKGVEEGLDNFHEACYTGGMVYNPKTRKVIQCAPLGIMPPDDPLDKDSKPM